MSFRTINTPSGRIAIGAVLTLCAMLVGTGCHQGHIHGQSAADVRFINSVPDSDSVAVSVDGKKLVDNIKYGDDSGYDGVKSGDYAVDVTVKRSAGQPIDLTDKLTVEKEHHYTAVAYAPQSQGASLVLYDTPKLSNDQKNALKNADKAVVRVFNAASDASKVDFLVNSIVAFKNIGVGQHSDTIPLAALPYEWNVKPAGNTGYPYGTPTTLQLKSGHAYLVVVMGSAAAHTLQIKAYQD